MFLFLGWAWWAIDAIDAIEAIEAMETIEAIEGVALRGLGGWRISGRVKIFFVGLQNFIYFWKLKLEMGLSTSAFCPWLAQPQCGYRLIISV